MSQTTITRTIFLLSLSFSSISCGPVVKDPAPLSELVDAEVTHSEAQYQIQPGDQLDIRFYLTPQLDESVTVRPDGRISLPLVNEVIAAGLSPNQLRTLLVENYASELKTPEITVIVRSFAGQQVFVDGEVNGGGTVPLTTPTTVLQAIFTVGGFTDRAQVSEVVLIRRGPNREPLVSVLNIKKALDGSDMSQDIRLLPFDMVYVPKKPIVHVNIWIDQYIRRNLIRFSAFGYTSPIS